MRRIDVIKEALAIFTLVPLLMLETIFIIELLKW